MLVESPERNARSSETSEGPRRGRAIVFAGVAGACALGVGAGLWARPAPHERQAAAAALPDAVAPAPPTRRMLEIVVNDRPLPPPTPAAPIAVLPESARAAAPPPPISPLFVEPPAPKRPPEGLIRTEAVVPAAPDPAPPVADHDVIMPAIAGALAATRHAIARVEASAEHHAAAPAPVRLAKADPPPKPARHAELTKAHAAAADKTAQKAAAQKAAKARAEKVELARAQAAEARAEKVRLAQVQRAKAQAAQAQASQLRAEKAAAHKVELARAAKAAKTAKSQKVLLAEAEARGRAEAREEARQEALADAKKRARLIALARAVARAMPHAARPEPAPVQVAQASHRHAAKAAREAKVERASLKSHRREAAHPAPSHAARARPELEAPQPAQGLMKVSTTPHCARSDPGEALVCADPSLGAADRQLSRAYQGARAAGVPDAQLRSQQQRWLAARSAAAREAPWAVRDVYMARIAELNGQAKEARDGY